MAYELPFHSFTLTPFFSCSSRHRDSTVALFAQALHQYLSSATYSDLNHVWEQTHEETVISLLGPAAQDQPFHQRVSLWLLERLIREEDWVKSLVTTLKHLVSYMFLTQPTGHIWLIPGIYQ